MGEHDYQVSFLKQTCEKTGIFLSDEQTEQFLTYYQYLCEMNQVMNLTAITDYEEVVVKHFADSLLLSQALSLQEVNTVLDLGTGAGFPGIPLKIVFPHLKIVLLDSLNKRVHFLEDVIEMLHLEQIRAVHARAEEAARKPEYREQFDLCVSRAVANLSTLSEYCLPFVRVNGCFVAYKSSAIQEECDSAQTAITKLGGKMREVRQLPLPQSDISRCFVIIGKKKHTAPAFPRKAGMPSRNPL